MIRKNILFMSVGIVIALFLAEVILRIAGIAYPIITIPDKERGIALNPNIERWFHDEGHALVRINSDGLRDYEHNKQKPSNTFRIAILGDSYAEARQVDIRDTFWSILQTRLSSCDRLHERQVEVINFGVSDFGTAQELITLRSKVWDYSPDVVFLAFLPHNDVQNNYRPLQKSERPYFVYRSGQLILDDSFKRSHSYLLRVSPFRKLVLRLSEYSRALQLILRVRSILKLNISRQQRKHDPGLNYGAYKQPENDVWLEAWHVTEGIIGTMHKEVQEHGAQFLVAVLTVEIQVDPDIEKRKQFLEQMAIEDFSYPDQRVKTLGEREGVFCIGSF